MCASSIEQKHGHIHSQGPSNGIKTVSQLSNRRGSRIRIGLRHQSHSCRLAIHMLLLGHLLLLLLLQ